MYRNTAHNINFYYRTNSIKIKDYFSKKQKQNILLAQYRSILPVFGGKEVFLKESGSVRQNAI